MPNIKSAKKRVNVIAKKTLRNQMIKSNVKTSVKKFEAFVAAADVKSATASFAEVMEKLDKAVAKGILHKNTVARKKSKLAIKLNKLSA